MALRFESFIRQLETKKNTLEEKFDFTKRFMKDYRRKFPVMLPSTLPFNIQLWSTAITLLENKFKSELKVFKELMILQVNCLYGFLFFCNWIQIYI